MIKLTELAPVDLKATLSVKDYVEIAQEMMRSYGVLSGVKTKIASIPGPYYATYDPENKTLWIYPNNIRKIDEFIMTILHEIYHMMDHKKLGDKFIIQYELAFDRAERKGKPEGWNKYEIKAEKFAKQKFKTWYRKFF